METEYILDARLHISLNEMHKFFRAFYQLFAGVFMLRQIELKAAGFSSVFIMVASDHDKNRGYLNHSHQKRLAFLMAVIFFLRDYTLSIKWHLYSAQ